MEPLFYTTYFEQIDKSQNPEIPYGQICYKLNGHLSLSIYQAKQAQASNDIKQASLANSRIAILNEHITSLDFTYLVFKIKSCILDPKKRFEISPSNPQFENAHKKAVEILLPSLLLISDTDLQFLCGFKFDEKCNLQNFPTELIQAILMSKNNLVNFETFKNFITKKDAIISPINFKEIVEQKVVEEPKVTKVKKKEKNGFCIIC